MKNLFLALIFTFVLTTTCYAQWFSGTIEFVAEYPGGPVITFNSTGLPSANCESTTSCTKRIHAADSEHMKRILVIALTAKNQNTTVTMDLCLGNTSWCGIIY